MNDHSNRGSSPDGTPLDEHDKSPDESLDEAFNDIFESDEWVGLELDVFPPDGHAQGRRAAERELESPSAAVSAPLSRSPEPSTTEIPAVSASSADFDASINIMTSAGSPSSAPRQTLVSPGRSPRLDALDEDVDGNQTMFGLPARRDEGASMAGVARAGTAQSAASSADDVTRGPWTTQEPLEVGDERPTIKPWEASLEEDAASSDDDFDDEGDIRSTFFGKPSPFAPRQSVSKAKSLIDTEETTRPAVTEAKPGPMLPRFGAGGGAPAPFRAPKRAPAGAPGMGIRRRSETLLGAPVVKSSGRGVDGRSRSGGVDTVERAKPNPSMGETQEVPRARQRPSSARTAALPALFAAKDGDAELEDDGKKTDPPWTDAKTRIDGPALPRRGDGLFRVPTKEALQKRTSSRRTLAGVPAVNMTGGALSRSVGGPPGAADSSPGEYVMGKARLTQSSSRIKIRGGASAPSQTMTGMPRIELPDGPPPTKERRAVSSGRTTAAMAVPTFGMPDDGAQPDAGNSRATSKDLRREVQKPGATMPLSVPVLGQRAQDERPLSESGASQEGQPGAGVSDVEVRAESPDLAARSEPVQAQASVADATGVARRGAPEVEREPLTEPSEVVDAQRADSPQSPDSVDGGAASTPSGDGPMTERAAASTESQPASDLGDVAPVEPSPAASAPDEPASSAAAMSRTAPTRSIPKREGAASAATGAPSEWVVRVVAMLAGGMCWLAAVSFVVALEGADLTSLPVVALLALASLFGGGLVNIAVGVMKLHMAFRALMMGLVGVVCVILLASSDWMPLAAYGDYSARLLVVGTLLLPMGLFWRDRYPASSLSRMVVGIGMVLLLVNYLAPQPGGVLRFESILLMFNEPGGLNMALAGAALLPLVLWLPSLFAFRSGEGKCFGAVWALMYCGSLLLLAILWAASALQPDEGGELLRWVGCGLACTASAASFSVGGGELLGWMTRPTR